jgi:hypothetical protein
MPAAHAVGPAGPALRAPLAVRAAGRTERVAVDLALPVATLAKAALCAMTGLAPALPVAEGLAVPVAMPGRRGAVHREFRDGPGRRVGLDAWQRRADQPAVQADLGVGRRRLGFGLGRRRLLLSPGNRGGRRLSSWRDRLPGFGRISVGGWKRDRLAPRGERRRTGRGLLLAAGRQFPALVLVFGVAGRASDLPDIVADERDHRMVAQPPLARTVVIDEITNPKLARMHAQSLENAWWEEMAQDVRFQQRPETRGYGRLRPPFEAHVAGGRQATKSDDPRHRNPWPGPRLTSARVDDAAPIITPFRARPKL